MKAKLQKSLNPEKKEVKKMKRILYAVTICAAFVLMASVAFASPITAVEVVTPDGPFSIGQMDWAPGSGLSVNGNFFGPGGSGNPLDLKYQAFLSVFLDPTPAQQAVDTKTLNTAYEFTVTANIWETVTGAGGPTVIFGLSPNATNNVTVYMDTSPDANVALGTGFNDGTAVITGTPISLLGVFTAQDTNGNGVIDNQDVGVGSDDIVIRIDTVDQSVFPTLAPGGLWISHFIGTNNTPPEGVDTVMMFDGTVPNYFTPLAPGTTPFNTEDILLKIDGNSHFSPVPEPSSIILIFSGLLGLGATRIYSRKRK